jgi:hypothetical protein
MQSGLSSEHPVLVVITSQNCPHCVNMKGDGWPSESQKVSIPGGWKWDFPFFKAVLTGGKNDGISRAEFFNIHYVNGILAEFTILSLTEEGKVFVRRFKKTDNVGLSYASMLESDSTIKQEDLVKPQWRYKPEPNFEKYRDSWIPSNDISGFLVHVPVWLYFSSTIWWASVLKDEPLYGYSPGMRTTHQPHDHTRYMIPKSESRNVESKDPSKVIDELIKSPDVLYYPPEHGKIYMRIRQ